MNYKLLTMPHLVLYSQIKLSKCVAVNMATAHPHYELDGAIYNLGSSFSGGAHYNIVKINPNTNGGKWRCK